MNDIRPYSISLNSNCGVLLLPRFPPQKVPLKTGGKEHFRGNKLKRYFFRYYGLEIPLGTLHAGRGANSGEGMELESE